MQIPGSKCFVCQDKIASTFVAVGCANCERFAHGACAKEKVCSGCGGPLIDGNALYSLDAGRLGWRTRAGVLGDEALERALTSVEYGQSGGAIADDLISAGIDERSAGELARSLIDEHRATGKKLATEGALWCLGGVAVSIVNYQVAQPGRSYMIWWGAIIFGAYRLFRGLSMFR